MGGCCWGRAVTDAVAHQTPELQGKDGRAASETVNDGKVSTGATNEKRSDNNDEQEESKKVEEEGNTPQTESVDVDTTVVDYGYEPGYPDGYNTEVCQPLSPEAYQQQYAMKQQELEEWKRPIVKPNRKYFSRTPFHHWERRSTQNRTHTHTTLEQQIELAMSLWEIANSSHHHERTLKLIHEAYQPATETTSTVLQEGQDHPFVHRHECDGCQANPILGKRFHAVNLPNYDLCEECYTHCMEQKKNVGVIFKETIGGKDAADQKELLKDWLHPRNDFKRRRRILKSKGTAMDNPGIKREQGFDDVINVCARVYQERIKDRKEHPKSQDVVSSLQQTPIHDRKSLVSWKGFHVGWFLNVFCKMPFVQQLVEFGCELWFFRKVCVTEIVRQAHCQVHHETNPALSGPFVEFVDAVLKGLDLEGTVDSVVQDPTTFISYTGGYTLKQTLNVLEHLDPDEYIWMDIFCVNQFAWTGKSRSSEMQIFKDTFLGDLVQQIESIGKTMLILEKWDDVMNTLEQIWVLWEVFNTAESGADLRVLLPPEQVEDFVEKCLEYDGKHGSVLHSLLSIDASKARSSEASDRQRIFERMEAAGLDKVNSLVEEVMRDFMVGVGEKWISLRRQDAGGPSSSLLMNVGLLLEGLDRLPEAEEIFREAVLKRKKAKGSYDSFTLQSTECLLRVLKKEGKLKEAEVVEQQLQRLKELAALEDMHLNSLKQSW